MICCVRVSVKSSRPADEQLGQAEIGDLDAADPVEQHVFGLDVAMHDPLIVGVLQGVANLRHDRQGLARGQPARADRLPQVDAIDVLHHQPADFAGLAKIVDGHDVGVIEPGQSAGLAGKPLGKGRVFGRFRRDHLQGHDPVEILLPGLIYGSHAAAAQEFHNFELRKVGSQIADFATDRRLRTGRGRRDGRAAGRQLYRDTGQAAGQQARRAQPFRRIAAQRRAALRAEALGDAGDQVCGRCGCARWPAAALLGHLPPRNPSPPAPLPQGERGERTWTPARRRLTPTISLSSPRRGSAGGRGWPAPARRRTSSTRNPRRRLPKDQDRKRRA